MPVYPLQCRSLTCVDYQSQLTNRGPEGIASSHDALRLGSFGSAECYPKVLSVWNGQYTPSVDSFDSIKKIVAAMIKTPLTRLHHLPVYDGFATWRMVSCSLHKQIKPRLNSTASNLLSSVSKVQGRLSPVPPAESHDNAVRCR